MNKDSLKLVLGIIGLTLTQLAVSEPSLDDEHPLTPNEIEEKRSAAKSNSVKMFESYLEKKSHVTPIEKPSSPRVGQICTDKYSDDPYCLQQKYKSGEYYLVKVRYKKEEFIPNQPRTYRIPGSQSRDTKERDAFLSNWSNRVLAEYLGSDYHKYNYTNLDQIINGSVGITVQILSSDELREILRDPRIIHHEHIANPAVPDEVVIP